LGSLLVLLACLYGQGCATPPPPPVRTFDPGILADEPVAQPGPDDMAIKGLFLGMPLADVPKVLVKRIADVKYKVNLYSPGDGPYDFKKMEYVCVKSPFAHVAVVAEADAKGAVAELAFPPWLSDVLFGGQTLATSKYLQEFAAPYPLTEGKGPNGKPVRTYTSPDGTTLEFSDDQGIRLAKTAGERRPVR